MRISDDDLWIESETPLSDSPLWTVPLRLIKAVATGTPAEIGSVPPRLARNLPTIRDIFAAWIENGVAVPLSCEPTPSTEAGARGVSLFFSGGVDSFYSLIKHRDEIDQLVLVHGFDIPLAETRAFASAEALVRKAAQMFNKKLIVVRTNVHWDESPFAAERKSMAPCDWRIYHGGPIAAVAFALAPIHHKVYVASTYSYAALFPCGSHPLLDPLWSTETVEVVHDGGEPRLEKMRGMIGFPEILPLLRVCWEDFAQTNCGRCEKCVRTMLALRALGVENCPAFPVPPTQRAVKSQSLGPVTVELWREVLGAGLPADLEAAVRSAIHSYEAGLPPHTGKPKQEIKRVLCAMRNAMGILRMSIQE